MITAKGIGFLVAAIILYLLARLTQVGWLYLVDAVLWGLIILSAAVPWLSTAFLAAQRRVESPSPSKDYPGPVEGEPLESTLTLHNRGRLVGSGTPCPHIENRIRFAGLPPIPPWGFPSIDTLAQHRQGGAADGQGIRRPL